MLWFELFTCSITWPGPVSITVDMIFSSVDINAENRIKLGNCYSSGLALQIKEKPTKCHISLRYYSEHIFGLLNNNTSCKDIIWTFGFDHYLTKLIIAVHTGKTCKFTAMQICF